MQTLKLLALFALALPASAQLPFVETFDSGSNVGSWSLGPPSSNPSSGGNPDWYISALVDTFAPQPRSFDTSSTFAGDYRARGVESVGIDLLTINVQFPFDRELTLILANDNGTPGNTTDDCQVYFLGTKRVPQIGAGWRSFDFFVDSQSTTMPAGWKPLGPCTDPDTAWNAVITDVSYVKYFYGNPEFFFIFDQWTVGLDNARISDELPTTTYCIGKPHAGGCTSSVALAGTPSAGNFPSFVISAADVINQKNGILFYGFGPNNTPFQGGTLCVAPPVRRTGVQFSGGNVGPDDCSGAFSYEFNTLIQGGSDLMLVAGAEVFAQYWYRDPASSSSSGLSDAGQFTIQP